MRNDSKQRLFEVMGRLDKTFKPNLNEGFEEIGATDDVTLPVDNGEEMPVAEKTPEEKIQELTAKVDELYKLVHGEQEEELPAEEPVDDTEGIEMENLQEWNFDKKKGEDKAEKEDSDDDDKKDDDSDDDDKEEDLDEAKSKKIPVAAIAKVGK